MQFNASMLGNNAKDDILSFWEHLKSLPEYARHELLHASSQDDLKCMVPLCLHADGAEMFRDDEHFVTSWSSAFGAGGASRDCLVGRYPISIVAERRIQLQEEPCYSRCLRNRLSK